MLIRKIKRFFKPEPKRPHECCRDPRNMGPVVQVRPDTSYETCVECQCRHYTQILDPGVLGLKLGGS